MGEVDPLGTRKDALDAFLDQMVNEGYVIETHTDTHAIISRRPKGLKRFTSGADPGRYVVEVDEDGSATMRPAEPRRT
jgi:tRNA G26 N,N-dimethylase Trm1